MTKKVALYARVSTTDKWQDFESQLIPLRRYVQSQWRIIYHAYTDTISWTKQKRPWLQSLLDDAHAWLFDVVLVWRFDRMSRSVTHLIQTLEWFKKIGIDFVSHQEQIDTSTPTGKLMFTIIGAMAQFERAIIAERVKAGIEKARSQWKRIGRKKTEVDEDRIWELKRQWRSIRKIESEMWIGRSIICRVLSHKPPSEKGVS